MGSLWVAKGPRFLQEEKFDGCSFCSQGSKFFRRKPSMGKQRVQVFFRRKTLMGTL